MMLTLTERSILVIVAAAALVVSTMFSVFGVSMFAVVSTITEICLLAGILWVLNDIRDQLSRAKVEKVIER